MISEAKPYDVNDGILRLSQLLHDKFKSLKGNGTCVIIGDDYSLAEDAIKALKSYIGCIIVNRVIPGLPHFQSQFNRLPLEDRCVEMQNIFVDVELIATADAAIVLSESNTAKLGGLLRLQRKSNSSHEYNKITSDLMFLSWHEERNITNDIMSIFQTKIIKNIK